jgi:hypothetical protein
MSVESDTGRGKRNQVHGKTALVLFCPPQIPHRLSLDWNWASLWWRQPAARGLIHGTALTLLNIDYELFLHYVYCQHFSGNLNWAGTKFNQPVCYYNLPDSVQFLSLHCQCSADFYNCCFLSESWYVVNFSVLSVFICWRLKRNQSFIIPLDEKFIMAFKYWHISGHYSHSYCILEINS